MPRSRASDHPKSVYVRESAIVPKLDEWIATLFDPANIETAYDALAGGQGTTEPDHARIEAANRKIADCDRRLAKYRAALDADGDPIVIAGWMAEVQGERLKAEREIALAQPAGQVTKKQIRELVAEPPGGHRCPGRRRPEAQGAGVRGAGNHGDV